MKKCLWCGQPLVKKQFANGALESPANFARRLTCNGSHGSLLRGARERAAAYPDKDCLLCHKRLEPRRWPTGKLESPTSFKKRKFCGQVCAGTHSGRARTRVDAGKTASRRKARRLIPPGACEICHAPEAKDVHHINGNWQDNRIENLQRICRSCHMRLHGASERLNRRHSSL